MITHTPELVLILKTYAECAWQGPITRGGACECPRVGVLFNFSEGGWRHAGNVQGGWCLWMSSPPPPFQEILYRLLIQFGDDDDYLMNETRRNPTTGRQPPSLFDKWHGIFYMPNRIDEAGHTKAFDYTQLRSTGGKTVQPREDSNRQHIGSQSNALLTEPSRLPGSQDHITPGPQQGDLLPTGGIVCKEQPRHEKAIPMGPNNL